MKRQSEERESALEAETDREYIRGDLESVMSCCKFPSTGGKKKNPGKMLLCLVIVKRCRAFGGGGKWAESVCGGWGFC